MGVAVSAVAETYPKVPEDPSVVVCCSSVEAMLSYVVLVYTRYVRSVITKTTGRTKRDSKFCTYLSISYSY